MEARFCTTRWRREGNSKTVYSRSAAPWIFRAVYRPFIHVLPSGTGDSVVCSCRAFYTIFRNRKRCASRSPRFALGKRAGKAWYCPFAGAADAAQVHLTLSGNVCMNGITM
jgi:hypothetical protein